MMVLFVSDDMAGTRKACEEWLAAKHGADTHMEISTVGALLAARREHALWSWTTWTSRMDWDTSTS
jgi:hypothetical protein